ncbi:MULTISPECIES: VIT1/CCC1 transporter family protein [Mesorhizobium]|uniref:VIT family protein n=1 Tax=Mesorhizobium denitrificans TaxID=2294114 RepID=A0A371XEK2_9HYPH|nr:MULTISPECIES: VIT family protein [Mesorhizobium]RFC67642.1 VIT family protein [Mesorhizobium denitrificans]
MNVPHSENHVVSRIGWLRAAVLGANDGIISTASIMMGVASAGATATNILLTGVAAMVAGALSMAAGEYVSVSSQADAERADLQREKAELAADPAGELEELAGIYRSYGLPGHLAMDVAEALTKHDALAAHARDELGISANISANPLQAAISSALSFLAGAVAPIVLATAAPAGLTGVMIVVGTLLCLFVLGLLGAWAGGASLWRPALRVAFWGAVAMGVTALVGKLVGGVI